MAARTNNTSSWFNRNARHQPNYRNNNYYKYFVSLLAVIACSPALAEGTNVAANPQASISGSVANQAVQINQGSLSTQSFSQGHYCNGAVLSLTPYFLQTQGDPGASLSRNFGGQLSISVPLDGGSVETCKALAKRKLEKERLDYELVRIKECINIMKTGFMIVPGSPFAGLCSDVAPIASVLSSGLLNADEQTTEEDPSSEPLPLSSQ